MQSTSETLLNIGNKIKNLRLSKDMTQANLAKLLNCSQTTIAEWERNEDRIPNNKHLQQLANIFDVSFDFLLGKNIRENINIPCNGKIINGEIKHLPKDYDIELPLERSNLRRFCYKIDDNFFEPVMSKNDYGIFQDMIPKDNSIAIISFLKENRTVVRKWRQHDSMVMLLETNPNKNCLPYAFQIKSISKDLILETNNGETIALKGVLVAVKKTLKINNFDGINYIYI